MSYKNSIRLSALLYFTILYLFFFRTGSAIRFLFIDGLLAYVPIEVSFHFHNKRKFLRYFLYALYLLFLPNNTYLLTDLIHLNRIPFYPSSQSIMTDSPQLWLMFVLTIGGILSLFYVNNRQIYFWTQKISNGVYRFILLTCLFTLSSYGVYLGRFMRLNSVDVFFDPARLVSKLFVFNQNSLGFILFITLLQFWLYQVYHIFQKKMLKT